MKVEEAKNKVCPFMSQYTIEKTDNNWQNKCICGDCMAWAYTKEQNIDKKEWITRYGEYSKKKDVIVESLGEGRYKNTAIKVLNDLPEDEKEGYCVRLES